VQPWGLRVYLTRCCDGTRAAGSSQAFPVRRSALSARYGPVASGLALRAGFGGLLHGEKGGSRSSRTVITACVERTLAVSSIRRTLPAPGPKQPPVGRAACPAQEPVVIPVVIRAGIHFNFACKDPARRISTRLIPGKRQRTSGDVVSFVSSGASTVRLEPQSSSARSGQASTGCRACPAAAEGEWNRGSNTGHCALR